MKRFQYLDTPIHKHIWNKRYARKLELLCITAAKEIRQKMSSTLRILDRSKFTIVCRSNHNHQLGAGLRFDSKCWRALSHVVSIEVYSTFFWNIHFCVLFSSPGSFHIFAVAYILTIFFNSFICSHMLEYFGRNLNYILK